MFCLERGLCDSSPSSSTSAPYSEALPSSSRPAGAPGVVDIKRRGFRCRQLKALIVSGSSVGKDVASPPRRVILGPQNEEGIQFSASAYQLQMRCVPISRLQCRARRVLANVHTCTSARTCEAEVKGRCSSQHSRIYQFGRSRHMGLEGLKARPVLTANL